MISLSLLATGAVTILTPYLKKVGDSLIQKAGERMFDLLTSFFNSKDKEAANTLKTMHEEGDITPDKVEIIENRLNQILEIDPGLAKKLRAEIKISEKNDLKVQNILRTIKNIRSELVKLYTQWQRAGAALKGDYRNQIDNQEEKLADLESELFEELRK